MTITEKQEQIIHEFDQFEDWMDKYNYIIDLGKSLPVIDEKYKQNNFKITGCQSQVWLHAKFKDGKVYYCADSDAIITKGLISLLIRILSDETPENIINCDMEFINAIGLKEHLSPTRSNGLVSMIKQMKLYALAFKTKQNI